MDNYGPAGAFVPPMNLECLWNFIGKLEHGQQGAITEPYSR